MIDSNISFKLECDYEKIRTRKAWKNMAGKGRKQFLETVAEHPSAIQYVKLFRMPLFLTVLDDEFKKYDDSVWEKESALREALLKDMPITLQQFSFPQAEIDSVIDQCVTAFEKK